MKTYLELCEDCDRLPEYPAGCYEFLVEGYPGAFGHLIEPTVESFTWNEHWTVDHEKKTVKLLGDSFKSRTDDLQDTLTSARSNCTFKVLKRWTNERFPIYGPGRELIADIERSAAGLFGIATYGVQLIMYREDEGNISIWVARRAANKALYPNKLGVTVGGSISTGESPFGFLVRESQEEASLPSKLIHESAKSVGILTYVIASDSKSARGSEPGLIRAEVQYIYDMKVVPDVTPTLFDQEVSEMRLYSIDEIKTALDDGEFTPANACLILDFFIRDGLVTYENEVNYVQILTRLRRPLGIYAA
ncbi:thiamine pyrophosphokinase [Byssothecium circinans]|uniref:Thiamine pyrophosphokinase n=1 Tax=Byssothecium circinans TaxID=147558 RepID=A0A6A5UAW2_9PLEO|nr:thiamine pyrophosphokinase [Byssothecium circinans]